MPLKLKQKGVRESTPNEMNGDNTAQGLYSDSDGLSLDYDIPLFTLPFILVLDDVGRVKKIMIVVWSWFLTHKEVPVFSMTACPPPGTDFLWTSLDRAARRGGTVTPHHCLLSKVILPILINSRATTHHQSPLANHREDVKNSVEESNPAPEINRS